MDEKALAKVNSDSNIEIYRPPQFMAGYDRETDFVVPRLSLMQATSDWVTDGTARPGEWVDIFGMSYGNTPQFIPIYPFKSRRRFSGKQRICASNDAITGQGDPGAECAMCHFAEWQGNEPGECALVYNFISLMIPMETDIPLAITFSGYGATTAKTINTALAFAKSYIVYELRSVQKENQKGKFLVPKVKPLRQATPEEAAMARTLYQTFTGATIEVDYGEEANESGAGI